MAIAKRKTGQAKAADQDTAIDKFIEGAPDGAKQAVEAKQAGGLMSGRRRQITHTIFQDRLDELDARAAQMGVSRAALINIGIDKVLND